MRRLQAMICILLNSGISLEFIGVKESGSR